MILAIGGRNKADLSLLTRHYEDRDAVGDDPREKTRNYDDGRPYEADNYGIGIEIIAQAPANARENLILLAPV